MKESLNKNSLSKNKNISNETGPDKPKSEKTITNLKNNLSPEVIDKFKNGDHKAFEEIFHTFYLRVYSFIKALIKTTDLAEDLSQQLFIDLWLNRGKVIPDKNISAYIYTMARNSAFTAIKQQTKFIREDFDHPEPMDTTLTDDKIIAKETELLINLTVDSMPPKRKQVYEMSRNENKTNEEIAKELNISKKVVEKHLRLAIKELRNVLNAMLSLLY